MEYLNIVLINLFWLSFIVIGYAFNHVIRKESEKATGDGVVEVFTAACMGFALLSAVVLVGSVLKLQVEFLIFVWLALLAVSVYICFSKGLYRIKLKPISKLTLVMLTVLAFDYLISTKVGGYLGSGGDAWMHLSKITSIMENHMGFQDAQFSALIDPRYIVNSIHNLMALAGSLLDVSAANVWTYSSAFFRLLVFLSVYAVSLLLSGGNKKIAVLVTIISVFALSYDTRLAVYPNNIVRVFYVYYILMLIKMLRSMNPATATAYLLGCLLVTMSHGPFSLGVFVLNSLLVVVLVGAKVLRVGRNLAVKRSTIYTLFAGSVILAVLPFISSIISTNRELISYPEDVISKFGLSMLHPSLFYSEYLLLSLLIVFYWMVKNKVSHITILVCTLAVLVFPLLGFIPGIFDLVSNMLPVQLIKRFTGLDFLGRAIAAGLPFLLVAKMMDDKVKHGLEALTKGRRPIFGSLTSNVATGFVFVLLIVLNLVNVHMYYVTQGQMNARGEALVSEISKSVGSIDFDNSLVVSDEALGYSLAAVENVDLVNSTLGHSAPSSNYQARSKCLSDLLSPDASKRIPSILALSPKYYFINSNKDTYSALLDAPELELLNKGAKYSLLKVHTEKIATVTSPQTNPSSNSCTNFDE